MTHLSTRTCTSRTATTGGGGSGPGALWPTTGVDESTPATLRIGDLERSRTSALLGRAFTSGHLDALEYEQRLEVLSATRTHRDLAELTGDLPLQTLLRSDPERLAQRRRAARVSLAIHTGAATLAVVLCWLIWLALALTVQAWYPWPVWPLLGAALGVASHALATLPLTRQPADRHP
jgi:hypothetical protein